ncbi:MAG: right-handed parallel beta-helix repeat-containing protein [Glaciihabitans sp.]|nr:right-handed parallel beta-helix repeat-containing protein [Glaciihabitans sp.]
MPVRAELTGGRLILTLLMLAVLPALLAFTAIAYSRPAAPPGPPAYNPLPLVKDNVLVALQARELQRSRQLTAQAVGLTSPQLVPATFPDPLPSIVLPARPEAYTLNEVMTIFPEAFEATADALLVKASIEVPEGSQLVIDSAATPNVHLLSAPAGFVTIIARKGTIDYRGTEEVPLTISSWDPEANAVDDNLGDGRAFLLTLGGRMNMSHSDIGYLGFGTGTSSGAAWRSAEHGEGGGVEPATGEVTDTVLHNNWFGAYSFEAEGMRWIANTFANNEAYGFDPHDLSNDFLVQDNVAHGNGRHGFIFSRGCDRNVLRDNVSYDNRGHGFMIDDGRSEDSSTSSAKAARLPSDNNQLINNHAYNNDGSGIEIEGGTGTVIKGNLLEQNHVGVRLKNDASAVVTANTITDSALAGVDVLSTASKVGISGNTIDGGWAGIALGEEDAAQLGQNTVKEASTPIAIAGKAVRDESLTDTIGRVFQWNPLLVLWSAILGVPTFFAIRSLGRMVMRRRPLVVRGEL